MSKLGHKFICLNCQMVFGPIAFGAADNIVQPIYKAVEQHLTDNVEHEIALRFSLVQEA